MSEFENDMEKLGKMQKDFYEFADKVELGLRQLDRSVTIASIANKSILPKDTFHKIDHMLCLAK